MNGRTLSRAIQSSRPTMAAPRDEDDDAWRQRRRTALARAGGRVDEGRRGKRGRPLAPPDSARRPVTGRAGSLMVPQTSRRGRPPRRHARRPVDETPAVPSLPVQRWRLVACASADAPPSPPASSPTQWEERSGRPGPAVRPVCRAAQRARLSFAAPLPTGDDRPGRARRPHPRRALPSGVSVRPSNARCRPAGA